MHTQPLPWMDRLAGRVRWIGVGSAGQQDDALGLVLARRLQAQGEPEVVLGELQPERCVATADLAGVDHVVFLDAADLGVAPGGVVFLSADEMNARLPSVSTHRIPLPLLARWVETQGATRAWLLGIQPGRLGAGTGLSPEVQRTIDLLAISLTRRSPVASAPPGHLPAGSNHEPWVASTPDDLERTGAVSLCLSWGRRDSRRAHSSHVQNLGLVRTLALPENGSRRAS